jgi:hypothetical protein
MTDLIRVVTAKLSEAATLRLEVSDPNRPRPNGGWVLAYTLSLTQGEVTTTVFEGEDFASNPLHAIDSHETLSTLLKFLALKPGDTDREFFEDYTPEQLDFAQRYGEEVWSLAEEIAAAPEDEGAEWPAGHYAWEVWDVNGDTWTLVAAGPGG